MAYVVSSLSWLLPLSLPLPDTPSALLVLISLSLPLLLPNVCNVLVGMVSLLLSLPPPLPPRFQSLSNFAPTRESEERERGRGEGRDDNLMQHTIYTTNNVPARGEARDGQGDTNTSNTPTYVREMKREMSISVLPDVCRVLIGMVHIFLSSLSFSLSLPLPDLYGVVC